MDIFEKGSVAEHLLLNEGFQEAVQQYTKQLMEDWERSTSVEQREHIWLQQNAIKAVVNNLHGFINTKGYEVAKYGE